MSTTDFQDEEISLCERSPSLGPSVAESSGFGAWTWARSDVESLSVECYACFDSVLEGRTTNRRRSSALEYLLCQEEEDDAAIISCGIFRRCGLGLCRPGNGYSQSGRATRGKPSGPPFNAHFIEVAAQAGQRTPTVYGEVDLKQHLIKTIGCGCAFFDYDNDGWLDIFLLSDTRIGHDSEGNQSFV